MKKLFILILCFIQFTAFAQEIPRIEALKNQIEALAVDNVGLTENVKTDISVANVSLSSFLLAVAEIHKLNFNISSELSSINIATNFPNVTVADLLIFLCKEHELTIEFTGNILSVKKYIKPIEKVQPKAIPMTYDMKSDRVSLDIKNDTLYTAFKKIMNTTGKNLVFSPDIENKMITFYVKDVSFDTAMEQLAFANQLYMEKGSNGFYIFENDAQVVANNQNGNTAPPKARRRKSNFTFKILDKQRKMIEVDFTNVSIDAVIHDIGTALEIDIFTSTPLTNAGTASVTSKRIYFDDLLTKMFESNQTNSMQGTANTSRSNSGQRGNQNNQVTGTTQAFFTFKKDRNMYIFGTANQLSLREISIIPLMHRSIELLTDSSGSANTTRARSSNVGQASGLGGNNQFDSFSGGNQNRATLSRSGQANQGNGLANNNRSQAEALINILPADLIADLQIQADYELNSFYVSGPSSSVNRFRNFIEKIDKPVPVILIEVMLIDVSKLSVVETGISWGIGDEATRTSGSIFPTTNLTLGAETVNRVIGGFDGFGSFNLGKVVPEFFANISAMEQDGDIKIRSTPKISTLNGHRATLSNGTTSYYAVTQRNIYGTDNPQTSEITNYFPIDAELGISIKPIVSGDGQVTLDIFVIQSTFGNRIDDAAPPDISSREFRSIVRMRDQDIAVLGGIEEMQKRNEGNGVPFLARIPVIKWLFSKRRRQKSKAKLTVLIKPTVIY
ncbi:type II secretion system protein D [Kordia sp. SMS9]|uniref:type II secretion system protein GspD n=1 Tax=Kordia sp. SMS9 TaxID=2282170 RepID=UPI000E0CE25B|nr:general secretion pathway protein GspD [Kordia sp. SMS9]AXG69201.1 type II secretion system protein D [Kordia sp. SMS9]